MAHSSLTNNIMLSPNCSSRDGRKVCKITPHHMAGVLSGDQCASIFSNPNRQASSNYCIGVNGDITCCVDETMRAWTSSSYDNDTQAITIEVSDSDMNWNISDKSWNALVNLCVDICKRYGFKLNYTGDASGSLTRHNMFANTNCPGAPLQARFPELAQTVNAKLGGGSTTTTTTTSKPASSGSTKYSVGTKCVTNTLATSSTGGKVYKGEWEGTITKVIPGAAYPYLLNDGTGWTNDTGIDTDPNVPKGTTTDTASKPAASSSASTKYSVGTKCVTNTLATSSTGGKVYKGEWEGTITKVIAGASYPYLLNDGTGWTNDTGIDTCPTVPKGTTQTTATATKTVKVGGKVLLKTSAGTYQGPSKGVGIPSWAKNKVYTVQQINGNIILLQEITSWVLVSDCQVL